MKFTHTVLDTREIDGAIQNDIACFQARVSLYGYRQNLDWYACNYEPGNQLVVTYDGPDVVATSIIQKVSYQYLRKSKYLIQGGPAFYDIPSLEAHIEKLRQHLSQDAIDIRISPCYQAVQKNKLDESLEAAGFRKYTSDYSDYDSTVSIGLREEIENITGKFSSSLRRQINKAIKLQLEVRKIRTEASLGEFIQKLTGFYTARGVGIPGVDMLMCFLSQQVIHSGRGVLLGTYDNDRLLSGIAVIGCGKRAVYVYGFKESSETFIHYPLTHYLHFEAIKWARENQYDTYDFGGYNTTSENDGINRFKLGFSNQVERVSGEYIYSTRPAMTQVMDYCGKFRNMLKRHWGYSPSL